METERKKFTILVVLNDDQFFCSNFLPLFKCLLNDGHIIHVASRNTGYKSKIESEGFFFNNISVRRRTGNIKDNIRLFFQLHRLYKKLQPNIIHHITLKIILIGTMASFISKKGKVVNHFCGLGYVFTLPNGNILRRFVEVILKVVLRLKRSIVLFENKEDQNEIIKISKLESNCTSLIKGAGIDLSVYKFTLPPDNAIIRILLPARMILSKGIMEFIEVAKLKKNSLNGKVIFILIGSLDYENPAFISRLTIERKMEPGYLEWKGFKDNMIKQMQKSDIIILPSYREGLSKSLMEACAIGRPIITTDVAGCRECVQDGYNGFLVPIYSVEPMAEKIEILVNDPVMRKQMGYHSREIAVKNFDLNQVCRSLLKIYESELVK